MLSSFCSKEKRPFGSHNIKTSSRKVSSEGLFLLAHPLITVSAQFLQRYRLAKVSTILGIYSVQATSMTRLSGTEDDSMPPGAEALQNEAESPNGIAASITADLNSIEVSLGGGSAPPAAAAAAAAASASPASSPSVRSPSFLQNGHAPISSLIGGRAAYESIGSALSGARARLDAATAAEDEADTRRREGNGGDAEQDTSHDGSDRRGSNGGTSPLRAIADRLRTLERAYSSRRGGTLSQWSGPSLLSVDEEAGAVSTSTPTQEVTTGDGGTDTAGPTNAGASEPLASNVDDVEKVAASDDKEDLRKDDRRNNLARSTSALLASRRLAAGAGYAPSSADGFGAAQASLLASIAERRESMATSTSSRTSVVVEEEEGEGGEDAIEESIETILEEDDGQLLTEEQMADDDDTEKPADAPPSFPGRPVQPAIYSWGSGITGALLHEDCSDRAVTPSSGSTTADDADALKWAEVDASTRLGKHHLLSMSASAKHAAVSTATGTVLSCGTNSYGVVDPFEQDDMQIISKPRSLAECLGSARVTSVSCGTEHTAAIRANGMVMTWGNDGGGRLGHRRAGKVGDSGEDDDTEADRVGKRRSPAMMQLPPGSKAASASCGSTYTLVLTTRREVLGCGSWSDLRFTEIPSPSPVLGGLPISIISAGDRHAVVVTEFGTAYSWGLNDHGCCGRPFPPTLAHPVPVVVPDTAQTKPAHDPTDGGPVNEIPFKNWARWEGRRHPPSLAQDVRVTDAACGNSFTILVCASGRLLVCGANSSGQLGLAPCEEVVPAVPLAHPSFLTSKIKFVSVEAGTKHAILLDDARDVWQTGSSASSEPLTPVICGRDVSLIAAGGDQSFAITSGSSGSLSRQFSVASDSLLSSAHSPKGMKAEGWASSLLSRFDSLIAKVVTEEKEIESSGAEGDATSLAMLASSTEELLSWPAVLGSLFMDPSSLDALYKKLIYSDEDCQFVRPAIATAIQRGVDRGLQHLKSCGARFTYPASVRCLLQYLQCPLFSDEVVKHTSDSTGVIFDEGGEVFQLLCETIVSLPFEGYRNFIAWATCLYSPDQYSSILIRPLLCHLDMILGASGNDWRFRHQLPVIISVLKWFHEASEQAVPQIVPPEAFYSDSVSDLPTEAMYEDLSRWKEANTLQRSQQFFLSAHPFLLSAAGKRNLLQVENQLQMVQAATATLSYDSQQRGFVFDPYWVLAIDRKHMLQQTLQKVDKAAPGELRKQLKVVFKGEDGVDAGGVTKEFFQLLVAQLFDVSTGMWLDMGPNNTLHWFNPSCTWNQDGYHLVGILLGLALYNGVLLEVDFPVAVWRKLLRQPLGLEDMVDKETCRGLQQLLDCDGDDVEDIFCLMFEHMYRDAFGNEKTVELKPGGSNIPVTSDNKEEYVLLYVQWLLVDSIKEQYDAFEAGFLQVMESSSIMHVLRSDELELLVVGSRDLDFSGLQKATEYEGGYDAKSPCVVNFWKFIGAATNETKTMLLKFATGSSRAPIGGLSNMSFTIQRGDPEGRQLPSSHTCFNTLILPDYGEDYDKLSRSVNRAILECEGFGLQ